MPCQKNNCFWSFCTAEVYYVFSSVYFSLRHSYLSWKIIWHLFTDIRCGLRKDHPRGLQNRGIQLSFIKPFKKINLILWENRNISSMKMKSLLKIPLLKMVKIRDNRWLVFYPHAGPLFYSKLHPLPITVSSCRDNLSSGPLSSDRTWVSLSTEEPCAVSQAWEHTSQERLRELVQSWLYAVYHLKLPFRNWLTKKF